MQSVKEGGTEAHTHRSARLRPYIICPCMPISPIVIHTHTQLGLPCHLRGVGSRWCHYTVLFPGQSPYKPLTKWNFSRIHPVLVAQHTPLSTLVVWSHSIGVGSACDLHAHFDLAPPPPRCASIEPEGREAGTKTSIIIAPDESVTRNKVVTERQRGAVAPSVQTRPVASSMSAIAR